MARDDQVELHHQRVWTDTRALEALCAAWGRHGSAAYLREATELYRGPFLAGFCLPDSPEFDTWTVLERERWTRDYLRVLATLIEALAVDADYPGAIGYAQRYLAVDALAEEMHRRLIELYALAGKRSAALQQFERCIAILEREQGVDPTPETLAVNRAVQHGGDLDGGPATGPQWIAPMWPTVQAPLIGRAVALGTLEEAYHLARAGRGGAILITGEVGVGKSRLMQEFTGRVLSQALVLVGRCYPETRTSP